MDIPILDKEIQFQTTKSSGPGGQNVNKLNTKIELRFDIGQSEILSEEEKQLLFKNLENKITKSGVLIISEQSSRSQIRNKEIAIERFYSLIKMGLKKPKKRLKTNKPISSNEKRLEQKQRQSEKKDLRKEPPLP